MADLSSVFAGIKAPTPFWLASAPPTDKAYNVVRAFEAGWGGSIKERMDRSYAAWKAGIAAPDPGLAQ